jgi:periplasmic divalent cation tolerance protein
MPTDRYAQVSTTASSAEEAQRIAQALVTRKLAACVHVGAPVRSTYRWAGEVRTDGEIPVLAKTTEDRVPAVLAAIRELHSYQVPELLVTRIAAGDPDYLRWLAAEVSE